MRNTVIHLYMKPLNLGTLIYPWKMCHNKGFYVFMNDTVNEEMAKDKFLKFSISIYAYGFNTWLLTYGRRDKLGLKLDYKVVFFGSIIVTLWLCARRERFKQTTRERNIVVDSLDSLH